MYLYRRGERVKINTAQPVLFGRIKIRKWNLLIGLSLICILFLDNDRMMTFGSIMRTRPFIVSIRNLCICSVKKRYNLPNYFYEAMKECAIIWSNNSCLKKLICIWSILNLTIFKVIRMLQSGRSTRVSSEIQQTNACKTWWK